MRNYLNNLFPVLDGEFIQAEEGLQRQGYGIHTTSDGLSYHGNWSGDKMNGQGRCFFLWAEAQIVRNSSDPPLIHLTF